MSAYYNEIEPYAAEWLRNLIKQGLIPDGEVDTRSIINVSPDDLRGFTQCHFFAGIGGWGHALRLAGWPDDRPVWTGSCPCQPFSAAGKGGGFADERHLWPAWHHLISQCRPRAVFGEQVASKDALTWLDLVHADMEAAGYAFGAVDLCAAGVGAPHIRQRLYFTANRLADASSEHLRGECGEGVCAQSQTESTARQREWRRHDNGLGCSIGELANANGRDAGTERQQCSGEQRQQQEDSRIDGLANAKSDGNDGALRHYQREKILKTLGRSVDLSKHKSASPTNGFWGAADWIGCTDDKWRPVEPGTFPLAHGSPARVGRLRGYGNAIVAPLAAEVISAFMDVYDA